MSVSSLKKPLLAAFVAALAFAPFAAAKDILVPEVIGVGSNAEVRAVAVTGTGDAAAWAAKAIGAHGAFQVKADASLKMNFTRVSATAVRVTISGADAFEFTSNGSDEMDAVWKAVDAAIVVAGKKYAVKPVFAATKLAFVRETGPGRCEIYAGDLMLPSARPLTAHGKRSYSPNWAADGRSVYYTTHFKSGAADVYRVNLATRASAPIATYKGTNTGGAASPDGSRIALALSPKGTADIYVAGADGSNPRAIVTTPDVEMTPTWSPTGAEIAFTGGASGHPQIMRVPASGGPARRVATGKSYATEPAWNPLNANQIAFSFGTGGGGFGIGLADVGGASKDVAVKSGTAVSHPSWCADGRHLVVTVGAGKRTQLGLLDTVNGKLVIISGDQFGDCSAPSAYIAK